MNSTPDTRTVTSAEHSDPIRPLAWHSWGSPIGLGLGLVCIGGFFALIALGLALLASIG